MTTMVAVVIVAMMMYVVTFYMSIRVCYLL
jgi:hypothetical protein